MALLWNRLEHRTRSRAGSSATGGVRTSAERLATRTHWTVCPQRQPSVQYRHPVVDHTRSRAPGRRQDIGYEPPVMRFLGTQPALFQSFLS